jgi:hypothetical protein
VELEHRDLADLFRGATPPSCFMPDDGSWRPGRIRNRNGKSQYGFFCPQCDGHWVLRTPKGDRKDWVSKDYMTAVVDLIWPGELEMSSVEEFCPVVHCYQCAANQKCQYEGCGRTDTDHHHTGPQDIFGSDCDHWPLVHLCADHHDEWHDRVTPYSQNHGAYKLITPALWREVLKMIPDEAEAIEFQRSGEQYLKQKVKVEAHTSNT